jgi:hypothetical protein
MTLRADLTALLDDAGIVDVDIDEAVEDEHVRLSAYRKVLAVVAAAQCRDDDRAVVSGTSQETVPAAAPPETNAGVPESVTHGLSHGSPRPGTSLGEAER